MLLCSEQNWIGFTGGRKSRCLAFVWKLTSLIHACDTGRRSSSRPRTPSDCDDFLHPWRLKPGRSVQGSNVTRIGVVAEIENFAPHCQRLHEITLQLLVARDGNLEAVLRARLLRRLFRADSEPTFSDPFGTYLQSERPSVRSIGPKDNFSSGPIEAIWLRQLSSSVKLKLGN